MTKRVFVVGVGMTKFEKPGRRDWDYPDMARIAVTRALKDADLPYDAVQQACIGYCYGDSTSGQRALYECGMTGIPIYNVNNNCSTGSTALYMARQFVAGGLSDCVLALGFEKMEKGSLGIKYQDRTNPMDKHVEAMLENHEFGRGPGAAQLFGNAGREHMKKYGSTLTHFAKIAEKNHRHSANNPYSQFRDIYTLDQIMKSPKVHDPLTKLQCCPTSDGAGAALVVSEEFVKKHGLQANAVEIIGMSMTTDTKTSFGNSMIKTVGGDMARAAAENVYRESGIGPEGVQVVELHDCFSANELVTYEALQLCPEGGAAAFIDAGDNTYGGKYVVNPSGGLISKGHPLGATGLAQCAELNWQLRGQADKRQVQGAKVALQHNLGLGGACVVTMYKKATDLGQGSKPQGIPPTKVGAQKKAPTASKPGPASMKATMVFKELEKRVDEAMVKKVGCTYRFDVKGAKESASWLVNLKQGKGSVTVVDNKTKADCSIAIADDDFVNLMLGKLDAQAAFMKGKIKVKGNMMLAMKLKALTAAPAKM